MAKRYKNLKSDVPSQSVDHNLMGNVSKVLKSNVSQKQPNRINEWKRCTEKKGKKLPEDFAQRLDASMSHIKLR